MSDGFWNKVGFKSKEQLKQWVKDNQPYYKNHIPEVYNYFLNKTQL
jgi:pyrroloquinoline quinone (PQQ) biosynthesis protein C